MPEFAPVINVSTLNGATGFRLDGGATGEGAGRAVGGGGDVNGDGFADLLIGAPSGAIGGVEHGFAWVVFGATASPSANSLAARVSDGTAYRFRGVGDSRAGFSVSNAGDVNGDGFDDLLIGAPFASPGAPYSIRGITYLVFGGAAHLEALDGLDGSNDNQVVLGNFAAAHGFRFEGVANGDQSGWSVASAGDIDGDGFADLIIGAPFANPLAGSNDSGASYVIFGGTNLGDLDDDDGSADGRIGLVEISAGQGMRIDSTGINALDESGESVSGAGDVNGDGFADVIVGARYADPNSGAGNSNEGAAFIVFGQGRANIPASFDLANATGLLATRLDGVAAGDQAGSAVSALGDINGDGLDDVLIGAPSSDPDGAGDAGSAFVVFGKSSWGASLDLSSLNGQNGFRLDGLRATDFTGRAVSAAGDVNGDGFQDLLIGADGFDRVGAGNAGAAYVVFGKASGFAAVIDVADLNGNDGFRIEGVAGLDHLGFSVAAAGDVNGDDFDDLIVGAYGAATGGGSSYIIYGHRAQTAVTRVGTELAQTINGGEGSDVISGLGGDDTLLGWEGDDQMDGGDGDDTATGGTGDDRMSGSVGLDTLTGDAGDDLMQGGSGNDSLDGGADDDELRGGSEADTFLVSLGNDTVAGGSSGDNLDFVNITGGGVTINLATGAATLPDADSSLVFSSVERLFGTASADDFTGNERVNLLNGRNGNDTLSGGVGEDVLVGGRNVDRLTGGEGEDRFDFNATTESAGGVTRDTISDFVQLSDMIDLSSIDAIVGGGTSNDTFTFIGTEKFTAAGQVRAQQVGSDTVVQMNTAGTSGVESSILLAGVTASTLTAADFLL